MRRAPRRTSISGTGKDASNGGCVQTWIDLLQGPSDAAVRSLTKFRGAYGIRRGKDAQDWHPLPVGSLFPAQEVACRTRSSLAKPGRSFSFPDSFQRTSSAGANRSCWFAVNEIKHWLLSFGLCHATLVRRPSQTRSPVRASWLKRSDSLLLFAYLLAVPLARQRLFHTLLFARFQVKGVTLDLFDDVFGLHLPLEAAKSILQGLALLNTYLCQDEIHLPTCQGGYLISIVPHEAFGTRKLLVEQCIRPTRQSASPRP